MKLRAPGFAQVHKSAEQGSVSTSLADLPSAEVRWAIPWQVTPSFSLLQCPYNSVMRNTAPYAFELSEDSSKMNYG